MLRNLEVVLVDVRFPENVGMAARACANMGCPNLTLVTRHPWCPHCAEKARRLATPKGLPLLDSLRVCPDADTALADAVLTVGATARVGGVRQNILTPEQAAAELVPLLDEGRVALVFGSEERGLTNEQIERCRCLVTIPTADEASSLNVAQAVLILLYECRKAAAVRRKVPSRIPGPPSRLATQEETERLLHTMRDVLARIDYLPDDNPDYFFLPIRRFLHRMRLRRHEIDILMGVCRRVNGTADRAERTPEV